MQLLGPPSGNRTLLQADACIAQFRQEMARNVANAQLLWDSPVFDRFRRFLSPTFFRNKMGHLADMFQYNQPYDAGAEQILKRKLTYRRWYPLAQDDENAQHEMIELDDNDDEEVQFLAEVVVLDD